MTLKKSKIGIIGLGYVGLPLAIAFGKKYETIGFDIDAKRVNELSFGIDASGENTKRKIQSSKYLQFTDDNDEINNLDYYIITVQTPVDKRNKPDFRPLINASKLVGKSLCKGSTVIYESTVYPGATEKICIPYLEESSKKVWKKDFNVGYSPERIVPGSKIFSLESTSKLTSGDSAKSAKKIHSLYSTVIEADVFNCASIKIAEAAKVLENTQRDVNIALMNEISIIFEKSEIDTNSVIDAALTKWNFLEFRPGMVGGHCISIDPYYLVSLAEKNGLKSHVIDSARKTNELLPLNIADRVLNYLSSEYKNLKHKRVAVMGATFKEDCNDIRNSKAYSLCDYLEKRNIKVDLYDPLVSPEESEKEFGRKALNIIPKRKKYHAIIFTVSHRQYRKKHIRIIRDHLLNSGLVFDVRGFIKKTNLSKKQVLKRL